jgi:hypothetical protein
MRAAEAPPPTPQKISLVAAGPRRRLGSAVRQTLTDRSAPEMAVGRKLKQIRRNSG